MKDESEKEQKDSVFKINEWIQKLHDQFED